MAPGLSVIASHGSKATGWMGFRISLRKTRSEKWGSRKA